MIFYSNIFHCTLFTFKRESDESWSGHNLNYYYKCFLSITGPFANVFITYEEMDIGFNGRLNGTGT